MFFWRELSHLLTFNGRMTRLFTTRTTSRVSYRLPLISSSRSSPHPTSKRNMSTASTRTRSSSRPPSSRANGPSGMSPNRAGSQACPSLLILRVRAFRMSTSPSLIPPAFPMVHLPAVRSTLPFSWFVALPSITPNSNSLLTFAPFDFVCVQHIP